MTEPRRLKDEGDELERMLIASAAPDAPSAASRAAAMRALGLAPPSTNGSSGTPSAPAASGLTMGTIAGTSVAVACAVLLWLAWPAADAPTAPIAESETAPEAEVHEATTIGMSTRDEPAAPEPVADIAEIAEVVVAETPRPRRGTEPVVSAEVTPADPVPPEPTPAASLADQLAIIDQARAANRAGDSARAIELLDDYDRRFPSGDLAPEAQVARIEALVRRGDDALARPLAQRFLAQHPTSTAARRVRQLVPGAEAEDEPPGDEPAHP